MFRDQLDYRYVGDWNDRDGNSNIEENLLSAWLTKRGYTPGQINAALHKLRTEADNHSRALYGNNEAVYSLLRYGVPVKTEAGKVTETVHLINWQEPEQNDFAIAQEVTLKGNQERRPDLVLYVKWHRRQRAGAEEQPREHRRRHSSEPLESATGIQRLVLQHRAVHFCRQRLRGFAVRHHRHAGKVSSSSGRRTRTTTAASSFDKYLLKMCRKDRLIELMHDFVLFDGGVKKLPRAHQYFGVQGGAG